MRPWRELVVDVMWLAGAAGLVQTWLPWANRGAHWTREQQLLETAVCVALLLGAWLLERYNRRRRVKG